MTLLYIITNLGYVMLEIMHLEEQNPPSAMAKEKHLSYKQSLTQINLYNPTLTSKKLQTLDTTWR